MMQETELLNSIESVSDTYYASTTDYIVTLKRTKTTEINNRVRIIDDKMATYFGLNFLVANIESKHGMHIKMQEEIRLEELRNQTKTFLDRLLESKLFDKYLCCLRNENIIYYDAFDQAKIATITIDDYILSCGATTNPNHNIKCFKSKERAYYNDLNPITFPPDKEYHGHWKEFYDSGQQKVIGEYNNGGSIKHWAWYYENGQQEMVGEYDFVKEHGHWTAWNSSGKIIFEGNYINGKQDGVWKYYYDNGAKRFAMTFAVGKMNGTYEAWYINGNKKTTGNYQLDKMHGKWIHYYENETVKSKETYYEDTLNGQYEDRYPSGKIFSVGKYKMGYHVENWLHYHENGKIMCKESYDTNGIRIRLENTET